MKKLVGLLLAFVMMFSLMPSVFADPGITLDCNLTCDGQNSVTKKNGDVITVTYTLENVADTSAGYEVLSHTNEIYYDITFFRYVDGSSVVTDGLALRTQHQLWDGARSVGYSGPEPDKPTYAGNQVIGTFQLEIIATEGSGTVYSNRYDISSSKGNYNVTSTDLVVTIGDAEPEELCTLTFETNGGTAVSAVKKKKGTEIDLSEYNKSVNPGFVFEGWYSDSGLTNKVEKILLDANKTVYAKWTEAVVQYTLTFNSSGGSDIPSVTANSGTVIDLTKSEYQPERNGYTFSGWYSDSGLTNKVTSITLTDNTTVYAKWSKDSSGTGGGTTTQNYTLTFDTNGGDSIAAVSIQKNTNVDLTKYIPKKDGYTFMGWYSDEDLENKIESIKITKNTTIYAGWEKSGSVEPAQPDSSYIPDILNASEHFAYIVGYEDGTVHPDANITRAEVATMVFRLLTDNVREENLSSTNDFRDVSADDWYNTSVSTMAAMGVLKGYEGNFRPNDPITRAEFAAIVARLSEKTAGNMKIDFEDIAGHWAEPEILKAASFGWVQGFDGYYRPDDAITRAEAMTIINRVLCRVPENSDDLLSGMKAWTDNMDTSKWYYINVQEATNSHDFEMKADGIHEKWTSLKENPNWAEIEQ